MTVTSHRSTDGQTLGERGMQTRQRILDVLAEQIGRVGLRGLRLADVAREVGFSPPAFYQYFQSLDDAIVALCQQVGGDFPLLAGADDGGTLSPAVTRRFVEDFFRYWDANRPVLWARNVAVTEGDARLREARDNTFFPTVDVLMEQIGTAQAAGRIDPSLSPRGLVSTLMVMIDRVGMLSPKFAEQFDVTPEQFVDAVAFVFDRVLGIEPDSAIDSD